jgi:hypothetical protein
LPSISNTYIKPSQLSESDIIATPCLDLTDPEYAGGTSISSGTLPKWELFGGRWMVKRQTIGTCDWANEVLVYRFCKAANIPCAEYYPVDIRYLDFSDQGSVNPTNRVNFMNPAKPANPANTINSAKPVECKAVLTKIFPANLEHYKNVRAYYRFGSNNDQIIDFLDRFPRCAQPYFDLLLVDYIFNQEDRHSNNFGITGDGLAPIFDSGACLFYRGSDSDLPDSLDTTRPVFQTSKFKVLGKPMDSYIKEFLGYGYDVQLKPLPNIPELLIDLKGLYSENRLTFIRYFLEKRCEDARKIFDEAREG